MEQAEQVCVPDGTLESLCGCSHVEGDLVIDPSVEGDLDCLHSLQVVSGSLSLSGLHVTDLTVFDQLQAVGALSIEQLDAIEDLQGLGSVTWSELTLRDNASLRSLTGLRSGGAGTSVRIENNPALTALDGLFEVQHQRVERLQLMRLPGVRRVDLDHASELGALVIRGCPVLEEIAGVDEVSSIGEFHLTGLSALIALPELNQLKSVRDLELIDLPAFSDLAPLSNVVELEKMSLSFMDSLTSLHGLEGVSRAERILIEDLTALESVDGLGGLKDVETFWIGGDDALTSLRGLTLERAHELAIRYNDRLQTLDGLELLGEVGTLDFSENPALVSVRALAGLRAAQKVYARANQQLPQCELDWLTSQLPEGTEHVWEDTDSTNACPGED